MDILEGKIDIRKKVVEFIERFNVETCSDLKRLESYINIKNENLKSKIYQRVYYLEKKNNQVIENSNFEKSIQNTDFKEITESLTRNDTSQILTYRPKIFKMNFVYISVIVFIFIFLVNESRLFYRAFGFGVLNSFLIPIAVEVSILLLSMSRDIRSRLLLWSLVLFNILSFSYYTVYKVSKDISTNSISRNMSTTYKLERERILSEYNVVSRELESKREKYKKAVNKKFISRANNTYLPHITALEGRFKGLSLRLSELNEKISSLKAVVSEVVLYIGAASLVILKILLQLVTFIFIRKLHVH